MVLQATGSRGEIAQPSQDTLKTRRCSTELSGTLACAGDGLTRGAISAFMNLNDEALSPVMRAIYAFAATPQMLRTFRRLRALDFRGQKHDIRANNPWTRVRD
ncbi:hypothetical protein [Bradyrhizobium sp. CCGE-LA001]|uniref:hypothetical protein n=1 Tax=Bradyrhizobium sp. CCGE-LA001 TaxID=1223566 RepID=UPI00119822AD|nr:hypothetical protein [Bradyrhizobium sp. CCGE-LA001]